MSTHSRFIGALDNTPERTVVKSELDVVSTAATNAASAAAAAATSAAVKPDWDAAEATAAGILNKPAIPALNDTLTSSSTTEAATANQVRLLNEKIEGIGDGQVVATLTDRGSLTGLDVGDTITVLDRGDSKWQDYKVVSTTDGTAANSVFAPRLDQDALAGATSATNLSSTGSDATKVTVASSTGSNVDLPVASDTAAGVLTVAQFADLANRNSKTAIPGDGALTSFVVNHGFTDDVVGLSLYDVTAQEYVGINIVRQPAAATATVGPFAVAPANATSYELHALRG